MFDNFNVNLRKNEGFPTCIPCIPIPEYSQSNAPLVNSRRRLRRISSGSHVLYTNLNLVNSRRRLRRISSGSHVLYTNLNCWFSLTWSTGMFFNENKRKRLHNNRVQFPEDLVEAPTWPPFLCLGAPTWRSWRHVKTENLVNSRRRRRQGVQSLCICSLSPLFCGVLVAVVVVHLS